MIVREDNPELVPDLDAATQRNIDAAKYSKKDGPQNGNAGANPKASPGIDLNEL